MTVAAIRDHLFTRATRKLTLTLGVVMAAQALSGLLFPIGYRDADWIRATWLGNDWFTMAVAVPLLLYGRRLEAREPVRASFLLCGVAAYATYSYGFYLFGARLNVFFPLYVVSMVLGVATLVAALRHMDAEEAAAMFRDTTPVRGIGGFLAFVGVGLASVWISLWAAYVFRGRPLPLDPDAFRLIAALDLLLIVPALSVGGVLLWRRHPWGYVIAAIAGIQSTLYLLVLTLNSVVAAAHGLAALPGELPLWGTLAAFMIAALVLLLSHLQHTRPRGRGSVESGGVVMKSRESSHAARAVRDRGSRGVFEV
jgi:hypothetical protein